MDATIARLTRACSTDPGDAGAVDALERALLRAGRTVDAFLLRWRRGEPSPVAAQLAAAQRPALEALSAAFPEGPPCPQCGPRGCGSGGVDIVRADGEHLPLVDHLVSPALAPITSFSAWAGARDPELQQLASLVVLPELRLTLDLDAPRPDLRPLAPLRVETLSLRAPGHRPRDLGLDALPTLRDLSLACERLTDEGAEVLVRSTPGLEALTVSGEWLTDAGAETLALLPRLRRLAIFPAPHLDGSFARALAAASTPIEWLRLSDAPRLDDQGLGAISELRTIAHLALSSVPVRAVGASDLALLPSLRRLSLDDCDVDAEAFEELAAAPIEELDLCRAAPEMLQAIGAYQRLRVLNVRFTRAPDAKTLAGLAWTGLERLDVGPIDDDGLCGLRVVSSLRSLELPYDSTASADGLRMLADLPSLRSLSVADAPSNDHLEAISSLHALRALTFAGSVDADGVRHLQALSCLDRLDLWRCGEQAGAALGRLAVSWLAVRARTLDAATLEGLGTAPRLRTLVVEDADAPTLARVRAALPWVEVRRRRPGERA